MKGNRTKRKQKINIQKVENDEDRLVTLSKGRSGIYTKLSELSILYGVDVGFLTYSDIGKQYTFGSPSFDTVAKRFLNGNYGEGSLSSSIVDAHLKVKIEELCKSYKSYNLEAAAAAMVEKDAWWKIDPADEEVKQLLRSTKSFMRNFVKLLQEEDMDENLFD